MEYKISLSPAGGKILIVAGIFTIMEFGALEAIGLSKNEIKIYTSLLEIGLTTSGPLIKKTGLNSSKVYEALARLNRRGLASSVKKTNKQFFHAAEPSRLLDYLEQKKKTLDSQGEAIRDIIPMLRGFSLQSAEEQQEATIYQGNQGYRTILENMLGELGRNGSYLAFASGMLKEILGPYWFIFQEKKKKQRIKALCLWDPSVKKQKDYIGEYYGSGRFLTRGSYTSPVDIWVYKDKVILASYKSKPVFAVLIKSSSLAEAYRELFSNLWETSKS